MTRIKDDPRVYKRPMPVAEVIEPEPVKEKADAKEVAPKPAPKRRAPRAKGKA
jgi:hypothetical protein